MTELARLCWLPCVAFVAFGCFGVVAKPPNKDELLKAFPNAAIVEAKPIDNPTQFLIHILDWHFVDKADFLADMKDQGITENLDVTYLKHLDDVEAVQSQQKALLQALKEKYFVNEVFIEGLSAEDQEEFNSRVEQLRTLGRTLEAIRLLNQARENEEVKAKLGTVETSHRRELLRIGAAGQLQSKRTLKVLPAEDKAAHEAARPVRKDGKVTFDPMRNDAREDAIVKNVLAGGPVSILILGGAHDLSDNVPDGCQYIRVGTKAYQRMAANEQTR